MRPLLLAATLVVILALVCAWLLSGLSVERSGEDRNASEPHSERHEADGVSDSAAIPALPEDSDRSARRAEPAERSASRGGAENPVSPLPKSMELVETSLAGAIDVDALLDWIQTYASLPIVPKVDLGYWDSDLAAFPMKLDREDVKIFFCKELEPSAADDGRNLTVCQLRIELHPKEEVWMEGLLRERLRVAVSISTDEAGEPVQFMTQLYAPVDLRSNWDRGVDFKSLEYREGLVQSYRLDNKESRCLPLLVRDGLPVGTDLARTCESFSPPKEEKVRSFARRLSELLKEVSR